jgi:adenine-specific DNA methylase
MIHRKKLIEVALPLDAINTASAREKSIRHGHPSTLHLWWARRPLAAARAVIFASDLNPIEVLICKAMIEIPPKFANARSEHLKRWPTTDWCKAGRRYSGWHGRRRRQHPSKPICCEGSEHELTITAR